jgi:hypothetical protein
MPLLLKKFPRFPRLIVYPALALVVAMMVQNVAELIIPSEPLSTKEKAEIVVKLKSERIWPSWWPVWAKEDAFSNAELVSAGSRKVDITKWEIESREFVVQPDEQQNVRVQSFYYPYWKATVNSRAVDVERDKDGVIMIPIPNPTEPAFVKLRFEEPAYYQIFRWLSALTWIFMLFSIAYVWIRSGRFAEQWHESLA